MLYSVRPYLDGHLCRLHEFLECMARVCGGQAGMIGKGN